MESDSLANSISLSGGSGVRRINSKIINGTDTATTMKTSISLQFLLIPAIDEFKKPPGNPGGF